jgi:hypothetical protein
MGATLSSIFDPRPGRLHGDEHENTGTSIRLMHLPDELLLKIFKEAFHGLQLRCKLERVSGLLFPGDGRLILMVVYHPSLAVSTRYLELAKAVAPQEMAMDQAPPRLYLSTNCHVVISPDIQFIRHLRIDFYTVYNDGERMEALISALPCLQKLVVAMGDLLIAHERHRPSWELDTTPVTRDKAQIAAKLTPGGADQINLSIEDKLDYPQSWGMFDCFGEDYTIYESQFACAIRQWLDRNKDFDFCLEWDVSGSVDCRNLWVRTDLSGGP